MGNVVRTVLSLLLIALNLTMKCEWLQKAVGGTIGGIKVYVLEKSSCKCRKKCRLPFFSYPQFAYHSVLEFMIQGMLLLALNVHLLVI